MLRLYCIYIRYLQISPGVNHRVSTTQLAWQREEVAPSVSADFDLTLDTSPVIHIIQQLNFAQLKGWFVGTFVIGT